MPEVDNSVPRPKPTLKQSASMRVAELDDYAGTIDDLIGTLLKLRKVHGGEASIKVDAGYNNVAFVVGVSNG